MKPSQIVVREDNRSLSLTPDRGDSGAHTVRVEIHRADNLARGLAAAIACARVRIADYPPVVAVLLGIRESAVVQGAGVEADFQFRRVRSGVAVRHWPTAPDSANTVASAPADGRPHAGQVVVPQPQVSALVALFLAQAERNDLALHGINGPQLVHELLQIKAGR